MSAHKGNGCIYLRGKRWWISFSRRGEKFFESSKSDRRSDAVKLLRRRLGEIDAGSFAPAAKVTTVAAILALVVADYKAQGRHSLPRLELAVKHLTEGWGARHWRGR